MEKYSYTCPNGHTFMAAAKLGARCPQCGLRVKRKFGDQSSSTTTADKKSSTTPSDTGGQAASDINSSSISKTLEEDQNSSGDGSSHVLNSKNTPKPTERKKAVVIKRGRPASPKKEITSSSVVKHKLARPHSIPLVHKKPLGSKERKVVEQLTGENELFWHKVKRQYFR